MSMQSMWEVDKPLSYDPSYLAQLQHEAHRFNSGIVAELGESAAAVDVMRAIPDDEPELDRALARLADMRRVQTMHGSKIPRGSRAVHIDNLNTELSKRAFDVDLLARIGKNLLQTRARSGPLAHARRN